MKLLSLCALLCATLGAAGAQSGVLVEAESFQDPGGWVLDTQFIEGMGSPYLLAHGLGVPVKDATTTVKLPGAGKYHLWVRTKDWVARWKAPGTPGKFAVMVGSTDAKDAPVFGTKGADWSWEDGGTVAVASPEVTLTLHDLTGFEGRCDAIYLAPEGAEPPPNEKAALAAWRAKMLGIPEKPIEAGSFDLVVCGGGYAGLGSAISAARMGCKVALIQDRPVLGGNGSSEVRVWAMGGIRRGQYPNIGGIVEEFMDQAKASPGTQAEFGDDKKETVVRAEKNITLFLNNHVIAAEMADPAHIAAVVSLDTRTSERRRFAGKLFVDSTGHGTIGFLAGAAYTIRETEHLGMSNMWRWDDTGSPQPFPDIQWALNLEMEDFPYPRHNHAEWFWEGGFNLHPIDGLEETRDWNFRAIYGAWNAMKNKGGKAEHANAKLEWIAYIGGTRESRQLMGDVVLNRDDITEKKPFPDGTVPTTWDIDLHYPKEQYAKKFPDEPFISKAVFDSRVDKQHGYPVPYRCMYSKNIENLFMAGRDISVTHEALGTVRVMKTGGMIGEVVGKAASICIKNQCTPRAVYVQYFKELQELLELPGVARRETVNAPIALPANYKPLPPPKDLQPGGGRGIDAKSLPGIVLDDEQAKFDPEADWQKGAGLAGFVGQGYRFRNGKSSGTARYEFRIPAAGRYEVRMSYGAHENRATDAPVTVESADGSHQAKVNERVDPPLKGFVSLGVFRFEPGKPAVVTIGGAPADGTVHVDAVQLLPQP
jgi:hypothetical protein